MDLRERAGSVGGLDTEAAAGVVEIEKDAAVFFGDGAERARDQLGAVAGDGAEDIAGETVGMDANEWRRGAFEIAADEREMLIVIDVAGIGDDAEIAITCGEN